VSRILLHAHSLHTGILSARRSNVALDEPIVGLAQRHLARVRGNEPAVAGAGGWMDSAFLAAAGIPTVIFGPDGDGAHADVKWVDLQSATRAADALLGIITEFCA
ncbi:MAG: M20/M25/M40 family metallo-hydrolase, partial [Thermomicrobiales bacterium]